MGEVVTSGDKLLRVEEEVEVLQEKHTEEESLSGSKGELKGLMRWEKFLPRMILRVLLVEADDSTRQIIAALLRKCSYKVAAVPDGLKAWELLKGRPHNVDLILTEVDLPSISGYALLTLIMEHDICKNIPVIMMSSQDSISTVYRCMLRGAADYLVKPIRKNELRNLWQHVWRRQSSTMGVNGPQDESVAQQKVEATAENNAASNRSSGDAACIQRNKELIEKGSDAQSSCTKPDLEAESGPVDKVQEFSLLKSGEAYPNGTETQEVETCIRLGQTLMRHNSNAGGIHKNGETSTTNGKDGDPEHFGSASISGEAHDNHYVQINSSREAIDLIGAFHTHPNCSLKNPSVNCTGMLDFSPQLDLSLRRSHPSSFENEPTEERHTLMHSNASAFKRYTNKPSQGSPPAVLINFSDQQKEQRTNGEKNISHIATGCNSDSSTPSTQRCILSPTTVQSKESELATSHSHQGHSFPIPVKGVRFNDLRTAYGSVLPPVFHTQSGPPSMPSPSPVVILEPNFQVNTFYQSNMKESSSEQLYEPRGPNGNSTTNHVVYTHEHKSEHGEERGHISPATDQSVSSSFCNGNASHLNSIGYGSNCGSNSNVDQVATVRAASEGKNGDLTNNGNSHRSIQREAALNKFRLKRKERCYEKKVRYESRKKLAEQRPRVKGQFVRQVHADPLVAEKDGKE
ncbi:two-component response regulator-like APRR5 isoform X2 [Abrus precatorius]|uniref:Two-component response regulator-like APRR5 isoform X2 n=1 Tax=Abrus precatorius TaxID=3816 RepID=A0A8B8K416_ABRPR|nr:two-component response regulator-like APRR5 isoform X2 [Abrus precatorius]